MSRKEAEGVSGVRAGRVGCPCQGQLTLGVSFWCWAPFKWFVWDWKYWERERLQATIPVSAPEYPEHSQGAWDTSTNLLNARHGLEATSQLCSHHLSSFLDEPLPISLYLHLK